MRALIVHRSQGNVGQYGLDVIGRAAKFNRTRGLKCDPGLLMAELSHQMHIQDPHTLCLACVDEDEVVRGHAIVHLQELYGYRTAMIYHLEIDDDARGDTREAMLMEGWEHIENWARAMQAGAVRTWAMNDKLAKVFTRYGLEAEPHVLMEKTLS